MLENNLVVLQHIPRRRQSAIQNFVSLLLQSKKRNAILVHFIKTWGGTKNTFILNHGTKWKWAVSFRFLSLDPRRGTARNHWIEEFYVYGSVHRWSILIIVQRDATQSGLFIILQVHPTCFGCQPHPSLGVHKTVTTASGNGHIFCVAPAIQTGQVTLQRGQGWPRFGQVGRM